MKEYRDFYFQKAKKENYPARSVYKLKELDSRFKLFRKGMKVLDLGAAPGSWSLGAAEKIGPAGLVVACDLKAVEIEFPAHVLFRQEDIFAPSEEFINILKLKAPFELVMSDMAPATTGTKFADQCRSLELAMTAFAFACQYLRQGANFVVKIFMGPDVCELQKQMRYTFDSVKTFKPKSSRAESKETFLLGLGLKNEASLLK